jgi:hypothetical protein
MLLIVMTQSKPHFARRIRWADSIHCYLNEGLLWVSGIVLPSGSVDLMSAKERDDVPPYVAFANSASDQELIDFTGKYGPVLVFRASSDFSPTKKPDDFDEELWLDSIRPDWKPSQSDKDEEASAGRQFIDAFVPLQELRSDQKLFAALVSIARRIQQETPIRRRRHGKRKASKAISEQVKEPIAGLRCMLRDLEAVAEGTSHWELQLKREKLARREAEYVATPNWSWNAALQEQIDAAVHSIRGYLDREMKGGKSIWLSLPPDWEVKRVVCTILDAFPTRLSWVGEEMQEAPNDDLLFGIRPTLMAMLKRDLMLKRSLRMCIRQGCGRYFLASRRDKLCCDRKCTELHNNRLQYLRYTKPRRQKQAATRKRKKR